MSETTKDIDPARKYSTPHSTNKTYTFFVSFVLKSQKVESYAINNIWLVVSKRVAFINSVLSFVALCVGKAIEAYRYLKPRHVEKYKENDESEKMDLENEIKEMKNSIRELTQAVKQVHKVLLSKAPSREEKEKECCFECEEADGNNDGTIFVKGFNSKLPRDEIKNALSNHFGSCGKITRVFVPIECRTGASLGFAFIDFENKGEKKALALSGSYLGGRKLEVMMAINRDEYYGFTGFAGCKRCATFPPRRRHIPTNPDLYLRH